MSIEKNDNQIRLSIAIKDFEQENEFYVREEFLVPIFKAAGYGYIGPYRIARNVNLSKISFELDTSYRNYIYPDFVLFFKQKPLWVIEAKSPQKKILTTSNISQLTSYSRKLKCPNAIISNSLETSIFQITNNDAQEIKHYNFDDICHEHWLEFINMLSPFKVIRDCYSINKTIKLYQTDDYPDRSFIMNILQISDFNIIKHYLEINLEILFSSNKFRNRALPSILWTPNAKEDIGLFNTIISTSLNDTDPIVRETCLSCLVKNFDKIGEINLPKELFSYRAKTILEKILYLNLISKVSKGESILYHYNSDDRLIKSYINLLNNSKAVSFPISLLLLKPTYIDIEEYYLYLSFLPSLIERLSYSNNTHHETIFVIQNCISYCHKYNKKVFEVLLSNTSKTQKELIFYYLKK